MFNNNSASTPNSGPGGLTGTTPSFGEIGKGNQPTQPTQPAQTTNQPANQPLKSLSNPNMNMFMKNP